MADEKDVELQRLRRKYDEQTEDLKEVRRDKQILEKEVNHLKELLSKARHDKEELIRMLAEATQEASNGER